MDNRKLIYVDDAIDAFKKELTVGESKGNFVTICSAVGYEGAKQILERLPSVQERKGRWIPIQRGFFNKEVTQVKCDQCGHLLDLIGVNCGRGNANFCPNCGAHMEGAEE